MLNFWLILLVPWLLDLRSPTPALETAFGALLWGVAVVVAAVYPRTRDVKWRQRLASGLAVLSGTWLAYWALSLFEGVPHKHVWQTTSLHWLTLTHSALLAAGAGMVLSLWLAAALWLIQENRLRQSSWERRSARSSLPSLESLARFCQWAATFAFISWFLGVVVAFVTAHLQWQRWLTDPKVAATAGLSAVLLACLHLRGNAAPSSRWLYKSYLALTSIFIIFFIWIMLPAVTTLHEPMRWFSR